MNVRPWLSALCITASLTASARTAAAQLDDAASATADLRAELKISPSGSFVVGSMIYYRLNVWNNGPDAASRITITDTLPAGFKMWSASGDGDSHCGIGYCFAGKTYCSWSPLSSGGTRVSCTVSGDVAKGQITTSARSRSWN